jgi:hypothetical protein
VANKCADCGTAAQNSGNLSIRACGPRCPTEDDPRGSYQSAGTQALVDAIRATGARQPILVPGPITPTTSANGGSTRPTTRCTSSLPASTPTRACPATRCRVGTATWPTSATRRL